MHYQSWKWIVVICCFLCLKPLVLYAADSTTPTVQLPAPQAPVVTNMDQAHEMTDIIDIKPPMSIASPLWWLVILIFSLILIGIIIGCIVYYLKKRNNKEKIVPIRPAHEIALQFLDELKDVPENEAKWFYFNLSAILRGYFEGRYHIDALEMTSEEFLPQLEKLDLSRELKKSVRNFVNLTDPVKFAGFPVTRERMASDRAFVKKFILTTKQIMETDSSNANL